MIIGNISKRPANITKDNKIFEKSFNPAKLLAGPTIPNPGPMLFKVATTALNADKKSGISKLISSNNKI